MSEEKEYKKSIEKLNKEIDELFDLKTKYEENLENLYKKRDELIETLKHYKVSSGIEDGEYYYYYEPSDSEYHLYIILNHKDSKTVVVKEYIYKNKDNIQDLHITSQLYADIADVKEFFERLTEEQGIYLINFMTQMKDTDYNEVLNELFRLETTVN